MEPKTIYKATHSDDWAQSTGQGSTRSGQAIQDVKIWGLDRQPTETDVKLAVMVYKMKLGPIGQVHKYNARICGKKFKKVEGGVHYETFAPNPKPENLRICFNFN